MRKFRFETLVKYAAAMLLGLALLLSLCLTAYAEPSGAHITLAGASEFTWACGVPWHDPGVRVYG